MTETHSEPRKLPTPKLFVIDVVGTCNLRCPSCPVGNMADAERPKGIMPVALYRGIVDKIGREIGSGTTSSLALYSWGEPLLHPDLPTLIRIGRERGFGVMLSSNLNRPRDLEAAVAAGPTFLRVSVSGSSNASYQLTHRGGDIDVVVKNMRALRAAMDTCGASFVVQVMYHVYLHNTGAELEQMRALCGELRFNLAPELAYLMPHEKNFAYRTGDLPLADRELLTHLAVAPEEADEIVRLLAEPERDCQLRANELVINWDGSVPVCCGTYTHPNVSDSFLDHSIGELQARRYADSECVRCMELNFDLSGTYAGRPELQSAINRNIATYWARRARAAEVEAALTASPAPKDGSSTNPGPRQLTLCLVVRDEADWIERCLDSVAGLVDEIVVVDTGSVDGTAALARRRATRVVDFPWRDDFGAARNEALRHATAKFVLVLDADEVLDPGAAATLRPLLERADVVAARVAVTNLAADGFRWTEWPVRLVRRFEGLSYTGRAFATPDESIAATMAARPELHLVDLGGPGIVHDGLLPERGGLRRKRVRNLHLLRIETLRRPDDLRSSFSRARELGADRDGFALAVSTAQRLLASGVALASCSFAPVLLAMAADGAAELGLLDEAESFLAAAQGNLPRCPGLLLARAHLLLKRGQGREALRALLEALGAPPLPPPWEQERTDAAADAALILVDILRNAGMLSQALNTALLARQLRPGSARLFGMTIRAALAAGKPDVALEQLLWVQRQGIINVQRLDAWGDAAEAMGDVASAAWFRARAAAASTPAAPSTPA